MKLRFASFALFGALLASAPAIYLDSETLATIPPDSTSYTYPGTGFTVASTEPLQPIVGTWTGLWIGSSNIQGSQTVTFTSDAAITELNIFFSAMSYNGIDNEGFTNFVTDGVSTISFTPVSGTTFDGTTVGTTINDGRGVVTVTSATGFTTLQFDHST